MDSTAQHSKCDFDCFGVPPDKQCEIMRGGIWAPTLFKESLILMKNHRIVNENLKGIKSGKDINVVLR